MRRWFGCVVAAAVFIAPENAAAMSCPMPTLVEEFDDAEAIVVARRRLEVEVTSLEVTLVVFEVKDVFKGHAFSWIVAARLPATSFLVDSTEDGIWFLRGRLWGLPELNDCGYSTAASEEYVMSYVRGRAVSRPPVSTGWCAVVPIVGVFAVWWALRRRMRRASAGHDASAGREGGA